MSTLYTIPLRQLRACKTNPRHIYTGIEELAESIKAQGIIQRLVVRELHMEKPPKDSAGRLFEIVAGHRRFKGAELAGLAEVPVEVRELTDAQVAEIQMVENLQRADLTPLDEAAGFRNLMANGIKADEIAAKVGKSRRYVFNKLKLLDLIPKAQDALAKGDLVESVALAIARVADPAGQGKVLGKALETDWQGSRATLRNVESYMEDHVLRRLDDARFKTTIEIKRADGTVVAGPCKTCPKRSGNQPELYPDKKSANFCTDPSCFSEKSSAAVADRLQQAREAGHTVATKDEAGKFVGESGYPLKGGLENLDHWESALGTTWRDAVQKASKVAPVPLVVIEHPTRPGEIIEAVDRAVVAPLLKAAGITPPPANNQAQREKTQAENAQTVAAMHAAFDALRKANAGQLGAELLARLVRSDMERIADDDLRAMLARAWTAGQPEPLQRKADAVAHFRGLARTSLESLAPEILHQMLADLALALYTYQVAHGWVRHRLTCDEDSDPFAELATRLGVDVEAVMREARAQAKAEAKAKEKAKKAAKAPKAKPAKADKTPPKKPAAKPAKAARKGKAKDEPAAGQGDAQEGAEE